MKRYLGWVRLLAAVAAGSFVGGAFAYVDANITCDDDSVRCLTVGTRTIYVFTNTAAAATVTANQAITVERLLVVGGGGAGGYHFGGGGGGGGVINRPYRYQALDSGATATVVVGDGGIGKKDKTWRGAGSVSYWAVGSVTNLAYGGGGGGNYDSQGAQSGGSFGSGGGGTGQGDGSTYTSSQGHAGGTSAGLSGGGGGGGAGAAGENGGQTCTDGSGYKRGGNGGEGLAINITGAYVVYGSGGGAGGRSGGYRCKSGTGGTNAADGYWSTDNHDGIAAPAGYGGGGGGTSVGAGGAGGSGTVILQVAAGDTTEATPIGFAKPKDQYLIGSSVTLDLVVTNASTGATLDPSKYTVAYVDNDKVGTAQVLVTTQDGGFWHEEFTILPVNYQDDNFYTTDGSVQRKTLGKRYAYIFTNAADATQLKFRRTVTVEKYLLVGGGGAGGWHMGGGGGGGGIVCADDDFCRLSDGDEVSVMVGAGGIGARVNATVPGQDTTLTFPGRSVLTAFGGGGGGTYDDPQAPSIGKYGSGGGGSRDSSGKTDGTHYTSSQGNYGGGASNCRAGGGGGAGTTGTDGVSSGVSGNGGEGRTISITGEDVVYASGGGGGGGHDSWGGQPGIGGTNAGDGEKFGGGWTGKRTAVDGTGSGGGGGCASRGGNGACGTVVLYLYPGDSTALQFAIDTIPDALWYGTPVTPTVTVRRVSDPTVVLSPGTDYTFAFANNNAAGTCTVTATGVAGSDYEGLIAQTTFNLTRAYQFAVAPITQQQLYFGSPITPTPAVTNAVLGVTPAEGEDFNYSYLDNDAAGTAKVIATGIGNYAGWAVTNSFTIVPTYSDDPNFIVSDQGFGVITLGKRKAYVFTNAVMNSLRVKRTVTVEKMLVVGGGGGGGGHIAGGGGGGGVVYSENAFLLSQGQDVNVVVGAGGKCVSGEVGGQGGTSYLDRGDGNPIEAFGGGGGGSEQGRPPSSVTDGRIGSAGGAASSVTYVDGTHYNSAQGTRGGLSGGGRCTTGGGGAYSHGVDYGQTGGEGITNSITGTAEVYGSGGGAGAGWGGYGLTTYGVGGTHAGRGGAYNQYGGTAGDPGFGGGGGGSAHGSAGGAGGSGTVILYLAERDTLSYRYTVIPPPTQVWTNVVVRPEPVVSNVVNGAILTKGVHYTLSWENCDGPGMGKVIATGVDGSDYDGAYGSADFTILDGCQFSITPIPTQYYYGEPVEPSVVVSNTVLNSEVDPADYGLVFSDNAAVGTATVTATGSTASIYRDFSASRTFEIKAGYFDDNVKVDDLSVRKIETGNRIVYVLTNAMSSKIVAKQDLTLHEFVVVGGGGQGGGQLAGGGGGGGVITNATKRVMLQGMEYVTTVGAGGRYDGTGDYQGDRGEASSFAGDGFSYVAFGGGGGGTCNDSTKRGVWTQNGWPTGGGSLGSGGGTTKGRSAGIDGDQFTLGQGFSGGVGSGYLGGGGGGAGGPGQNSSSGSSGNGGEGITNSITGVAEVYGSGGGGGGANGYGGAPGAGGTHAGNGSPKGNGTGFNGDDGFGAGGGGGGWEGTRRGGYGGNGTVILSFSVGANIGQPELAEKDVTFEGLAGYAIPHVAFTLGGEEGAVYAATVVVSVGVEGEEEARVERTFVDQHLGAAIAVNMDFQAPSDKKMWCDIVITATGAVMRHVRIEKAITGNPAPFIGHGGGAGVVHVWAGAPGDGSGGNWFNAVTNVRDAVAMLSATKTNVWIVGDWTIAGDCPTTALTAPAAIRGGFVGSEDAPSDRTGGARSVLDGANGVNIFKVTGSSLLTLDGLVFTRSNSRAVERTGGSLVVTNCVFDSNGRTVERVSARALYAEGTSSATLTIVDTTFALNTEKGTYSAAGTCLWLNTFKRAYLDNCTFATNGIIPNTVSGTTGYGEGDTSRGGALLADSAPLTVRNCRFLANKTACRYYNGGAVRIRYASYPSAFTNCLFVGNSERQPHHSASEYSQSAGALVIDLNSASGAVDVDNCTFAWNLADCTESPAGIHVLTGALKVRNSIFWGNQRRDTDKAGVDIDVNAGSTADVDYSLFAENSTNSISYADGTLTFGAHNVFGNPKFATKDEDLAGIVLTNVNKSSYNFIYFDWNRLDELVRFNAHLGGSGGYLDERTGTRAQAHGRSAALDAGDPAHDYSKEPADTQTTTNGKRVNLGYYGNTPNATMSLVRGSFLRLR